MNPISTYGLYSVIIEILVRVWGGGGNFINFYQYLYNVSNRYMKPSNVSRRGQTQILTVCADFVLMSYGTRSDIE